MLTNSKKGHPCAVVLGEILGFLLADLIGLSVVNAVGGIGIEWAIILKLVVGYQIMRLCLRLLVIGVLAGGKN